MVAEGRLIDGSAILAEVVLAKHDEKYSSAQIVQAAASAPAVGIVTNALRGNQPIPSIISNVCRSWGRSNNNRG